jgi:hypothetical protein
MRLVAERRLGEDEIDLLGCFREGYETLRETIRENKALGWWASGSHGKDARFKPEDGHIGFEQYRAVKALAEHFAVELSGYQKHDEEP